jgi:hypothetical protein
MVNREFPKPARILKALFIKEKRSSLGNSPALFFTAFLLRHINFERCYRG